MAALGPRVRKTSPRISPRKSPRFGPRLQGLREKESLELGRTDFTYKDFENGTPKAKVQMLSVRPDIALGKAAGRELSDVQYRIYFIILSSLIVAILTTVSYTTITGEHKLGEYLVAAFSISWFIFVSFLFLLFDATRLLHIIFFVVVLGLISNVYHELDKEEPAQNKKTQNIITATTVFAAGAALVLLYYYLTSRKEDELLELKTKEKLRQRNEDITKLVKEAEKKSLKDVKQELKERYEGYEQLNKDIIDRLINGQIRSIESKGKKGKGTEKEKDSDE
jgi:hypothetical protein